MSVFITHCVLFTYITLWVA